jgi:hypothetical protein
MTARNHKMGELSFDRFPSFPRNASKTLVHRQNRCGDRTELRSVVGVNMNNWSRPRTRKMTKRMYIWPQAESHSDDVDNQVPSFDGSCRP